MDKLPDVLSHRVPCAAFHSPLRPIPSAFSLCQCTRGCFQAPMYLFKVGG